MCYSLVIPPLSFFSSQKILLLNNIPPSIAGVMAGKINIFPKQFPDSPGGLLQNQFRFRFSASLLFTQLKR